MPTRMVTAAPGVQPALKSILANGPAAPNDAAESRAISMARDTRTEPVDPGDCGAAAGAVGCVPGAVMIAVSASTDMVMPLSGE